MPITNIFGIIEILMIRYFIKYEGNKISGRYLDMNSTV